MNKDRFKVARPVAQLREGKRDWYRITDRMQARDEDGGGIFAEIYIYDEIGYWGITAANFVAELTAVTSDRITVHLNTPGGEVFDGLAIYGALKQHQANVTVHVDSLAASIGSVIAMAGDRIIMARNATMMIHDGHGLCAGNATDMRELADLLDKTSDNIASVYTDRAGGTVKDWRKKMKAETWYNADEAVKAGLADEVAAVDGSPSNSWDLSIFNYTGRDTAPDPEIPKPVLPWDPDVFRSAMKGAMSND